MPNFKFIKLISVFFVLAFVLFSHNVSLAQEQAGETLTKIEIKDVKIEKKENSVKISAVLENSNPKVEALPFNYLLTLEDIEPLISPKSGITPPSLFVSTKEDNSRYSLEPSGEKSLSLSLPINSYLPKGNYALVLRILSDNGEEYGYYEDVIFDLGNNQKQNNNFNEAFLAFDQESCVIVTANGEKYKPNEGPIFNPVESPKINCLVKNVGNKEITVYPVVEWKEYFVYGRPSTGIKNQKKLEQEIKFLPGETKNVMLSLPGADKPQVYQSLLSFIDANNENRSFNMSFRWTVGGNSARVDKITLSSPIKNVYRKGETISLSVDYFGSMDLYWKGIKEGVKDLGNLKILATIKDKDGNICGTSELKLPDVKDSYSNNQKIDITFDKKCENISYNVSLVSDDKELAEGSGVLPKVAEDKTSIYYFGLGLIFVIMVFFLRKFRKNKNIGGQTMVFLAILAITFGWFSLTHSETTVTYPDDNGRIIRGETVKGGTATTYSWGGKWNGGTLWLKASRGENNERQAHFSVKGYDGNEVDANFSNYFNNDEKIKVSTHFKYAFSGCGNEIMYVRARMIFKTDNGEDYINFRPYGGGNFNKYEDFTVSANTGATSGSKSYEIQKSELLRLYDNAKKLKANPKVILEYTMIMDNTHAGQTASKLVIFGTTGGNTINETFNLSDVINIEIPLNLPAPSADLSLASISGTSPIDYNCKPTLNWMVNDVDSCDATGAGWSGTLDKSNGTHSKTMLQGITAPTNYGLSCSKNLGSAIGEGTYTDSVTVDVNARPTADLKANGSDYNIEVNPSSNVVLTWTRSSSWSSCNLYSFEGSNVTTIVGNAGVTGSANVTMGSVGGSYKTFSLSCSNSCVYKGVDSQKATVIVSPDEPTSSSSSSSGGAPGQPQNFTARAACQKVNLEWNKDVNGQYDTSTNNGSTVVEYYVITRDGSVIESNLWSNINRGNWSNNSYTDYGATDTGKEYSYTIKACNDQDECSAEAGPTTAIKPNPGPCTVNPSSNPSSNPTSSSSSADPGTANLTVVQTGTGSGSVSLKHMGSLDGNDSGFDTNISGSSPWGLAKDWIFQITATPSSGSYLGGVSGGGCSDSPCTITMNTDKTVTVTFSDSTSGCVGCGSNSVKAYISARDTVVSDGNSTVVTWTSDNATSCEQKEGGSDTGWISASDTASGNYTTANFTTSGGSRTYTIECTNGSQKSGDVSVTVDVGSDYSGSPSVTMWADPQSVGYKKTAKIKWMASNIQANQCYVLYSPSDSMNGYMAWYTYASLPFGNGYYKSGIGSNNTTGQITGKLTSDTTYKIQCKGYGPSYTKVTAQTIVTAAKPVSNFTLTNSSGKSLVATIVEGLSADSSSIALALSGETIGKVNLSASIPAISGAKAQFATSADNGGTWSAWSGAPLNDIDISATPQIKIRAINIPGATPAGTYNTAVIATDTGTGGKTKKLNVDLRVDRVSSEWEEF